MTHKAIASCCNQGIQVTKIDNQGAGSGIDLTALKRHPYSALFSRYDQDEDDRQEMANSIKNVGLLSPVTMCQNEVLDGWNSLQACKIAGVTPVFEDLAPGLDAWEFVKAKNLLRRHMTPVERVALMAAKVRMDWGEVESEGGCSTLNALSVRELAEELDVSIGTAHKVHQVLHAGDPEIMEALANRTISLVDAAEIADLPAPERPKAVAASMAKAARPHAPRVRVKLALPTQTVSVKPPTPSVQATTEGDGQEVTILALTDEINELADALEAEGKTNEDLQKQVLALQKEVMTLRVIMIERDEKIRDLSLVLAEALDENALLKGKTVPDFSSRIEQAVGNDPEIEETVEALDTVDETPVNVAVMDNVALEEDAEIQAAVAETVQDTEQAETLLGLPSPLAVHTQGLLKVCPRSPKNPDEPDKRTKEYHLYGDAEDVLKIEGRLQHGAKVSDDDKAAYCGYLKKHGLAAAVAMPCVVIQEWTSTLAMPPETADTVPVPPREVALPKAPASAVTTPISEASVNSKIPAPGLESTVKESGEILDPESCLCFTRALAEGLSPAPAAAAIS